MSEAAAVRLFLARAEDARGERIPARDRASALAIVRLLGSNKPAILLAAARADRETPGEILAALRVLAGMGAPDDDARRALVAGEASRVAGRLGEATRHLRRAKDASLAPADVFAEAEALRLLGAVARAQGRHAESLRDRERALALHERLGDRAHVAVALGDVGTSLAALGRLREARVVHERAIAIHRELGRTREEGIEWSYLGVALHRAGRFWDAMRAHERALEIHRAVRNRRGEAADRMHLGYVGHEVGRFDESRGHYEAALAGFRAVGDRALAGVALSYWGALEVEARRPEAAGPLLREAQAAHRAVASRRHEAVTLVHLAQHHAVLGERVAAREAAVRALSRAKDGEALEVEHRAFALALAGRFRGAERPLEDEVTARAVTLLALAARVSRGAAPVAEARRAALEARGAGGIPFGSRVRFALGLLEESLASSQPALALAADGTCFVDARGRRVDLSRRAPLTRIFRHLIERRLVSPGEPSSSDVLVRAGWPGEKILHDAAQIRVRNALAQLRKLGLHPVLVTRGGGWLLDPAVRIATSL
ncbi:MAG: tetratricopeptide repeat protein [Polyangiaceae bacterium]